MKRRQFLTTTLASGLALAAAPAMALPEPLRGPSRRIDENARLWIEYGVFDSADGVRLEGMTIYRNCRFLVDEIRGENAFLRECVIWKPPGHPRGFWRTTRNVWLLNCFITTDLDEARLADFPEALA